MSLASCSTPATSPSDSAIGSSSRLSVRCGRIPDASMVVLASIGRQQIRIVTLGSVWVANLPQLGGRDRTSRTAIGVCPDCGNALRRLFEDELADCQGAGWAGVVATRPVRCSSTGWSSPRVDRSRVRNAGDGHCGSWFVAFGYYPEQDRDPDRRDYVGVFLWFDMLSAEQFERCRLTHERQSQCRRRGVEVR